MGAANYRLTVEYEGTRYRGWQKQQNARSVAGELEAALSQAGAEVRELGGAGRTDAGVHAVGQVAHLRLAREIDAEAVRRAANDLLPADIHIRSLVRAPERFHARHDAESRSYVYQISRRRSALAKRSVWWVKRTLDVEAMGRAAAILPGPHDFRLFCERPDEQTSTKVVVERVDLAEEGALILIRLVASHFLWKMVRRVVGALVEVGSGDLSVAEFEALVLGEAPSRRGVEITTAEWTAPPSGLFLEAVLYAGDPPLGDLLSIVPVSD